MGANGYCDLSLWAIPPEGKPFLAFKTGHTCPDYRDFYGSPKDFPYQGDYKKTSEFYSFTDFGVSVENRHLIRSCRFEMRRFANLSWREREQQRFSTKQYIPLPKEWSALTPITDHFTHLASMEGSDSTEADYVAFTENDKKGQTDVQTRMRAGKYVKKFYPELDNDQVRFYASAVQSLNGIQMTDDPETAAIIYENGPDSCMKRTRDVWPWWPGRFSDATQFNKRFPHIKMEDVPRHPVAAYFAGDLQLAWMGPLERPTARCVVWPEKKQHGRVYGAHVVMKAALAHAGYEDVYFSDSRETFDNARLSTIRIDKDMIVLPYLDGVGGVHYVRETSELRIGRRNGPSYVSLTGGSTEGTSYFRDPNILYCALTGVVIEKGTPTVNVENRDLVAIRSEAEKMKYVNTVEDVWTRSPILYCVEDREELHAPNIWNMPSGTVRDYMDRSGRDVYRPRSECVNVVDMGWTRRGNIHKLVEFRGKYYRDSESCAAHNQSLQIYRKTRSLSPDVLAEAIRLSNEHMRIHGGEQSCGNTIEGMYRAGGNYLMYIDHFTPAAIQNVRKASRSLYDRTNTATAVAAGDLNVAL